jgi:hypothetical protein
MRKSSQHSGIAWLTAIAAGATFGVGSAQAQLVDVAPSKANGDYIAGSGIPGDNFITDGAHGAAVYLKGRGYPGSPTSGQSLLTTGTTFINVTDSVGNTPLWSFDFQFSPRLDDLVAGRNYTLSLDVDLDGTSATSYFSASAPLFDADSDPLNSWDDTDGFFLNPGGGAWSEDDTDYVFSQSWRPGFSFINAAELVPGDYTINWSALSENGNPVGALTSTVRLIPPAMTALTLDAVDACLDAGETQLVVALNLSNPQALSSGAQVFLDFDTTMLDFVSADVVDTVNFSQLFEVVDEGNGTIDYAVNANFGTSNGTTTSTTLATITFDVVGGDYCETEGLVSFRSHMPPTRVTEFGGGEILPYTADLGVTTKDSVVPTLAPPADITVNADAGGCDATLDYNEPFDAAPATSASQAPGVWYTDRYAPAVFESAFFDGDNRLKQGVRAADNQANRPGSFSGGFYNYQGRKIDVNMGGLPATVSIDVYVDSTWASGTRAGIWTTMSNGNLTFPIIEYCVDGDNDDGNGPTYTGFRYWQSNIGWTATSFENAPTDQWYTLEIELNPAFVDFEIDGTNIGTVDNLGAHMIDNIILNVHNEGTAGDYDVYWDNLTTGPEWAVSTDNCSVPTLSFARGDDPLLGLNDPFPSGSTTVTWTATDACGNTTTDTQTVTVNSANDLKVDVDLAGVSEDVDRCITFELTPTGGGAPVVVSETLSFIAGSASTTIDVPCGDYECITARDTLHTLRQTDESFTAVGPAFVAEFTTSSGDALRGGNFNDDEFIDILDFGVFIGQFGTDPGVVGGDTICGTVGPDADASGNGDVDTPDFTYISTQFLHSSEAACPSMLLAADNGPRTHQVGAVSLSGPVASITLAELESRGLAHLSTADLNGDGVLDQVDIAAFMGGALPANMADVTGDGVVDLRDLQFMADAFRTGDLAGDVNRDGVMDLSDLNFVIAHFGSVFTH